MNEQEIEQIIRDRAFPDDSRSAQLNETHISWVILTDSRAYKIKKPLQFSFLDFSSIDQRQYYCRRERELNARLSPEMYLDVLPVVRDERGHCRIGRATGAELIDYALQMQRMDETRQMNHLLRAHKVRPQHMEDIARILANFHRQARQLPAEDRADMQRDFADIAAVSDFLKTFLGAEAADLIRRSIDFTDQQLRRHEHRFQQRAAAGYYVDGHGDLHSKNIFLLDQPVIFDCIEFNDHLRHLDVLNEIAFFSIDLDYYGQENLRDHFLKHYLEHLPCIETEEDWRIYRYYRLYRANVRLKVTSLQASQKESVTDAERENIQAYFQLFSRYFSDLQA